MILQNQAQLLALQPQNSPHFLYNTLSAIQGMAYQKRLRKSAPPSPPSPT
nr:histidine kinase [uncultured Acetatifactor sp.]